MKLFGQPIYNPLTTTVLTTAALISILACLKYGLTSNEGPTNSAYALTMALVGSYLSAFTPVDQESLTASRRHAPGQNA